MPVEEGQRYRLKEIDFTGNKAVTDTAGCDRCSRSRMATSSMPRPSAKVWTTCAKHMPLWATSTSLRCPTPSPTTRKSSSRLRIDLDEGKQFFVRRIEFQGNTTTRDKVIRRELAIEEGQVYNGNLWELSLLRLNQLQYFEALKPEQDSEIKQNVQDATVDITLKVKEKGKNSIGLTGGVSGLAGRLYRAELHHQQFVWQGRKPDGAIPDRPVPDERDTFVYPALSV